VSKETYYSVKRDLVIDGNSGGVSKAKAFVRGRQVLKKQISDVSALVHVLLKICVELPFGGYVSALRDLLQCQKRPTTVSKETYSKETYYSVKRDLLQCQKR
jgi:hypothetical protein